MSHATVRVGPRLLEGLLDIPDDAAGIVVFAHGSGSSRLSPRNRQVAAVLRARGLATLLFDLLSEEEARDRRNVFDIPLLGRRVAEAVDWVVAEPSIGGLPIGLFGASTGAAAALVAAVERPGAIAAVVSRGGRPDLAAPALGNVKCPTLLIVGGDDVAVLDLNEAAFAELSCEKSLVVIPGATHLFEEPGTLDEAIDAAARWFGVHLRRGSSIAAARA